MSRTRSLIAVLAVVALALPALFGATTAPEPREGVGDARAGLVGAHLEIEDVDGLTAAGLEDLLGGLAGHLDGLGALDTSLDLGLIEGLTTATTRGTPDALASLSPLRIGDDRPHDVAAGPGESEGGDAVAVTPVSALLSALSISPYGVSADADEGGAIAVIEAVEASLDALGVAGLDIGLTGVVSEVTRTGASAEQDLSVDDLRLGLGDILPAELLELLPLDSLLSLIEELGAAGLLEGVDGLRGQLDAAVTDATDAIDALDDFDVSSLGAIDAALLDELADLLGLHGDLDALELTALLDALDEIAGLLESELSGASVEATILPGELTDLLNDLGLTLEQLRALELHEALSELGFVTEQATLDDLLGLLGDADDAGIELPASCLETGDTLEDLLAGAEALTTCVNGVLALLDGLITDLQNQVVAQLGVDGLLGLIDDVLAALGVLDGIVDTILGHIDGIAGIDVLRADTLDLEVLASADAEGGATSIVCELGSVEVLGQSLGDLSCDGGTIGDTADAALAGALGVLGDVLTALPGVSGVDGLRLDLLPIADENVTTDADGTVTATAHAVLLELVVPSVTIDPSGVTDLLDLPPLPTLDGLAAEVTSLLGLVSDDLAGLLPEAELAALTSQLNGLVAVVDGLLGTALELIGDLDLDVLGLAVSTPSISLVLDPVSEATFTAAAEDAPGDTDPDPTPVSTEDPDGTPEDPAVTTADPSTPELPKTGGGIALLGLLAMMGAVGLRRAG